MKRRADPVADPQGARVPYPAAETTVHLIEEQARSRPDAVALIHDGVTVSYAQLDGKANTLARTLLDHGADRQTLLPLLIDDGIELPVALVAAMKAAIPFIPFDPAWPREHIDTLTREVGGGLVLASPRTKPAATDGRNALTVDHTALTPSDTLPPRRPARPDLAYGFFTSGTTGTPKCTLNLHGGLLNRLAFMTRRFGPGHVSLQNSRSTFDSSLWQLLWPLTSGGSVVMPRRDGLLDLERTIEQIGGNAVTITDFVPSIFTVLVDLLAADPELVRTASTLRHVLLGGEAINVEAVQRFYGLLPGVRVTNTYGPTEASIGSVFYTLPGKPGAEIPLGRPIDNTIAVVVGENLEPLGPDETGEVLIGGDCLGAGYLNDPVRTAAAFIRNPFPDLPGDRLYRTGDLARYRSDGQLYFVGRRDDQLKVRGVRIEPADLERNLAGLPGVHEIRILALGGQDRVTLVAAVVAGAGFDPRDARARAKSLLPAEFVPDRFVAVDSLPLSPNGKTDRGALARKVEALIAGDGSGGGGGNSNSNSSGSGNGVGNGSGSRNPGQENPDSPAPVLLDEREQQIQALWSELTGTAATGPDTSFFDVGGTSLNAHRLVLGIQQRFGRRVTVLDIMRSPTIRAQALLVAGHGAPAYDAESVRQQMLADAQLPDWFHLGGRPARTVPAHILLTGASGFVGAHLLDELLRATDAMITCLVNASDGAAAGERLNNRAQRYGLQHAADSPRVTVLRGDLSAERFGLSADRFDRLAAEIDTIVHAGAEVNLLHSYRRLRAVNVEGTREVLRLAVTGQVKPIHHVSTLGILPRPAEAADLWLDEQTFPGLPAVPPVGYEQTKWVAESLLRAAGSEGLPVNVYRLGEVMPHTGTGVFSHGGSLAEFILEACVELGVRIETGAASDFTPVDNVCRFVAAAVRRGETGHCFHVVQPEPLRLDDLIGHFGAQFALEPVDYAAFAALVADRAAADTPQAGVFARLAAVLPPPAAGPPAALSASFRPIPETGFSDRCRKLSQLMDVHWIPVDRRVFETYALSFRAG